MTDQLQTVIERILGTLWPGLKSAYQNGAEDSEQPTKQLTEFQIRLNSILKAHKGEELKDQVYLLDLTKIKDHLGAKWDRSIEKIHIKVEGIIKAHLTARDLFIRRDDASYLVVFDALPHLQGHLKANVLNEEIARALVGVKEASSLICVMDVAIDKKGEVLISKAPDKNQLIAEMVDKADQDRAVASPPAGYETPLYLDDIEFIYRPMLVTRTRVVSTYVCIPVHKDKLGQYQSGYSVLGATPSPQELFELDHLTEHVAAEELAKLIKNHARSLIALPVHFETLANIQRRLKYLANLESIMQNNTDRIVFEMVGLPENIPQPRILEFTSSLRRSSRAVIARFSPDHGNFPAYRTAGLHAVGIDVFSQTKSERMLIKDIETFVSNAKENQLRTYAHGIRSISLLTAAICTGFDYLDGYALSSIATGALDVQGFSLAAPYLNYQRSLMKKP
ncbi:hypothetical protein [Magnetovibrio sp.]|uniref:hypothetical protein n=1 Tax=Magnetovibrio sp. TaxID=2024836 RepID=UPI002F95C9FE